MKEAAAIPTSAGKIDWLKRTQDLVTRVAEAKEEQEILCGRLANLRESIARADEKLKSATRELVLMLKTGKGGKRQSAASAKFQPRGGSAVIKVMRYLFGHSGRWRASAIAEGTDTPAGAVQAGLYYLRDCGMASKDDDGWQLTREGAAWFEKHNPGLPPTQ